MTDIYKFYTGQPTPQTQGTLRIQQITSQMQQQASEPEPTATAAPKDERGRYIEAPVPNIPENNSNSNFIRVGRDLVSRKQYNQMRVNQQNANDYNKQVRDYNKYLDDKERWVAEADEKTRYFIGMDPEMLKAEEAKGIYIPDYLRMGVIRFHYVYEMTGDYNKAMQAAADSMSAINIQNEIRNAQRAEQDILASQRMLEQSSQDAYNREVKYLESLKTQFPETWQNFANKDIVQIIKTPSGQQSGVDNSWKDTGYVGGVALPNGEYMGGHPSDYVMAKDRAKAGIGTFKESDTEWSYQPVGGNNLQTVDLMNTIFTDSYYNVEAGERADRLAQQPIATDSVREIAKGVYFVPGSLSEFVPEQPPYSSLTNDVSKVTPILSQTLKGTPEGILFGALNVFQQPEGQKGAKKAWSALEKNPLIGDIYTGISSGLDVLSKQEDLNKKSYEISGDVNKLSASYRRDLNEYNTDVDTYTRRLNAYNKTPSDPVYNKLIAEKERLDARKIVLDQKKTAIDDKLGVISTAEQAYNSAVSKLTGDTSGYYTAGASKALRDFNTAYEKNFVSSIKRQTKNDGAVGEFIVGLSQTPEIFTGLLDSGLYAGETLVRNPQKAPELLAAGGTVFLGSQASGLYEQGKTNPAGLAGQLIGAYLLSDIGSKSIGKVSGVVSTKGMKPVTVEALGYDAPYGYPLSNSLTEESIKSSFKKGTLEPYPDYMKLATGEFTEKIPYVLGKGGRPPARLPGDLEPTDYTLYTAHESGRMSKGVNIGEAYKITQSGHSELSGVSAAPVLESYYNKGISGGQGLDFGWESPFKVPTSYITKVSDLESIPKSVTAKGWEAVNKYIQERARPGGVAYTPLIKAEYEANIPTNSVFEVTGKNYYTKIGGYDLTRLNNKYASPFTDKHFLGVRVPLVEQRLIGFEAPEGAITDVVGKEIPIRKVTSSYKARPAVNLVDVTSSVAGNLLTDRGTLLGSASYGKDRTRSITTGAYSRGASSHILPASGTSYKSPSNGNSYGSSKSSKPSTGYKVSSSGGKSSPSLSSVSAGSSYKPIASYLYGGSGYSGGGSYGGSGGSGGSGGGSSGSGSGGSRGGSSVSGGGSGGSGSGGYTPKPPKTTITVLSSSQYKKPRQRRKKPSPKYHWEWGYGATPAEAIAFAGLGGVNIKTTKKNTNKQKQQRNDLKLVSSGLFRGGL